MKQEPSSDDPMERNWLVKLFDRFSSEPRNREHLLELLRAAATNGLLDSDALGVFEGAVRVSDMQVREIMVPRAQMVCLKVNAPPEKILAKVIRSAHSRFPVIGGSKDDVLGILLAKDLLPFLLKKEPMRFDISTLLRPAQVVPESKRLNVLLREFRENRYHMVVVIDEYGGVAGLATIEDVLEEIVGEIEDEYDETDQYFHHLSEHEYQLQALMPIEALNTRFHTRFSSEEYDTIGGLVTHTIGHLPQTGEEVDIENIHFLVTKADKRRIYSLQMTLNAD